MDNASNCDTLALQVEAELNTLNIPFVRKQNRIRQVLKLGTLYFGLTFTSGSCRCFPHVVNLAVQDVLGKISATLSAQVAAIYDGDDLEALEDQLDDEDFVGDDVVAAVRCLVGSLRVSGQR